jgi:hypothetical protein
VVLGNRTPSCLVELELTCVCYSRTAFRALDIHEFERILLEREDFEHIQYKGFKVDRRFFEVATSY